MLELRLRTTARRDLKGIWTYSADAWNAAQADRYLRNIRERLATLMDAPDLGRLRDDVRPGLLSLRVESHIAYYTVTSKSIWVVRVLHARMDPMRHL